MKDLLTSQSKSKQRDQPAEAPQKNLLPNISAGLIVGILQVFLALSFAALIFVGELSPYVSQGIGFSLVGMIISGLIIAIFTSLPGTIGGSQGAPAAIMAIMATAIAVQIPSGGSSPESFVTIVAAIAVVTLATGLFFLILGRIGMGDLVRFLPYPVVGGFLAGTGWLFLTGAIGMMVDFPVNLENLPQLLQSDVLVYWLPGFALAVIMFIVTHRSDHYLILPAFLIGGVLLFYVAAALLGYSTAELSADGWLIGEVANGAGALWQPLSPILLSQVNWPIIFGQVGNIMAIIAVSVISLLLNNEGLELATERDLEVNRELQAAGLANILTGFAAGLVGYKMLSLSTLNFKLGGRSRLPGVIAALICTLVLLFGAAILAVFPKVVIGSLLLLLGLNFLFAWVFEGLLKMPKIDYAIILVILFVTIAVGFLEAVALGLLLAIILFVISYSQVNVIQHELDCSTFTSRVSRSRAEEKTLIKLADRQYILVLQGFVFFGTANTLLNRLRQRVQDSNKVKPQFVVLDFKRVSGLDSTGMLRFQRMKQLAQTEDIVLVFTEPNKRVMAQLRQGGFAADGQRVRIFPSLDKGVAWCEDQLLAASSLNRQNKDSLMQNMRDLLRTGEDDRQKDSRLAALFRRLEKFEVDTGHDLIKMGDPADDLYFVESGRVTAQLPRSGQPPIRLESSGSGKVIGEIGFYLGLDRTADVVADTPCVLYRVTKADLRQIEETDAAVAATLHEIIVNLLAERVVNLTHSLKALEG
jgi:SulP family sulfate permease